MEMTYFYWNCEEYYTNTIYENRPWSRLQQLCLYLLSLYNLENAKGSTKTYAIVNRVCSANYFPHLCPSNNKKHNRKYSSGPIRPLQRSLFTLCVLYL